MKMLNALLFNSSLLITCCCMAQSGDRNGLKPGMSDIEVKKMLGEPAKIEPFTTVKNNTFDTSVYWSYPNNTVVVLTNHLYERIEKNRDDLLTSIQQRAAKKDSGGLRIVTNGKK